MEEDLVNTEIVVQEDVLLLVILAVYPLHFPAANATSNLTLRPFLWCTRLFDDKQKKTGLRVIDAQTHKMTDYYAKIIFLNAGTINSTLVLLNSTSSTFPNGLGNTNDAGSLFNGS